MWGARWVLPAPSPVQGDTELPPIPGGQGDMEMLPILGGQAVGPGCGHLFPLWGWGSVRLFIAVMGGWGVTLGVCWEGVLLGKVPHGPPAPALPLEPRLLLQRLGLAWASLGTGVSLCPQHGYWDGGWARPLCGAQGSRGAAVDHVQGREWVCTWGCSQGLGQEEGGAREGGNFPIKLVKSVQSPVSLLVEGSGGGPGPHPGSPPGTAQSRPPLAGGSPSTSALSPVLG